MLFSATFPMEVEELASAVAAASRKRISMGLSRPAHTVTHALFPVPQHLKPALLLALLKQTETDSVLIFTRTSHRAQNGWRRRSSRSRLQGDQPAQRPHAGPAPDRRSTASRSGRYQIMVATDIAARGLDVESISHVINFDMPDTADAYIHRIGRTGRAERTGDAFTLVTPDDEAMVRTLERIMGQPLPRQTLTDFDYTTPAPERPNPPAQPVRRSRAAGAILPPRAAACARLR